MRSPNDPCHGEEARLALSDDRSVHWKKWGPYLSERSWGTVREDYSESGDVWRNLPHDAARSKAYRWDEDGLLGICDRRQLMCFALALWNGKDPILKERLFGLTGPEGNHGEDVKEAYYYLDSTPTHAYMRGLYKYPQAEYPYARLVEENARRSRLEPEVELWDLGVFEGSRYFDVEVEYAKADVDDILVRITVHNRGPEDARLELLPTFWFRNTWSWLEGTPRPHLCRGRARSEVAGHAVVEAFHPDRGHYYLHCEGGPPLLFTENETNAVRLYGTRNPTPYVKDGIGDHVIHGLPTVNPDETGTKVAARYVLDVPAGGSRTVHLRLSDSELGAAAFLDHDALFARRIREADEFYGAIIPAALPADGARVMRQALSGLLWSKQFYHYVVADWLTGDPTSPPPPGARLQGRNHEWTHLYNADVLSVPDKWEYPWYAAWDTAFHCVALALVDPELAKEQLILLVREWYMHPNGQIPAYEWKLSDVNPPVHAWATWRVYKIEQKRRGKGDRRFLERVFHKLMLNFTWWVNRKDAEGKNIFQGGFLGLDNIGIFDRSAPLPTGGFLEQSDGTSWMAQYCLNMLAMALELARENRAYEDVASKFWEHFVNVAHAMNTLGLWDGKDGFYYDVLHLPDGRRQPMTIRSMVGLTPLFAVETLDYELLESLPSFKRRMDWFLDHRPDLTVSFADMRREGEGRRRLLSIVDEKRLVRLLEVMLDEAEFLSPYGIRSLSRVHDAHPYVKTVAGVEHRVEYVPGESDSGLFGGNSNWRGPIWFPVNYLLIEALQKLGHYYGDGLTVEMPRGSGKRVTLEGAAAEISRRLTRIFLRGEDGKRAVFGDVPIFQDDPHFRDHILFYEYFHGDHGKGLGASHQTGWTGLVAKLLQQSGV